MEINDFVKKLSVLAPTRADLLQKNLSPSLVDKFLERYRCYEKLNIKKFLVPGNSLLQLLTCYDCTKVQIGIISFEQTPLEKEDYFQIGTAEQDILVLSKITLEVEVRDPADEEFVVWKCSSNADSFLAALILCVDFYSKRIKDPALLEDQVYTHSVAELCAEQAGGAKYLDFFKMLLGDFT